MFATASETVSGISQRRFWGRLYQDGSTQPVFLASGWQTDRDAFQAATYGTGVATGYDSPGIMVTHHLCNHLISCAAIGTAEYWGNSTYRTQMSQLKTNVQTSFSHSGKVGLFGISAGACNVLQWAQRNPTLVSAIVIWVPAVNPQRFWDEDTLGIGLKASLTAAYGGRPSDADCPMKYAEDFQGIPMIIGYSQDDGAILPADVVNFGTRAGARLINQGSPGAVPGSGGFGIPGGHYLHPTYYNRLEIAEFFVRYAA